MTKTVWFTQAQLKAVAPFMSSEQNRYYICGVYCDPAGVMVATDGHKLGAVKAAGVMNNEAQGYIIPASAVKQAAKLKQARGQAIFFSYDGQALKAYQVQSGLEELANSGKLSGITGADLMTIAAQAINGTFPDWRRVIPTTDPKEGAPVVSLNAGNLEAFAVEGERAKIVSVVSTAREGVFLVLNSNKDFVGVIMAYRADVDTGKAITAALDITGQLKRAA